MRKVALTYVIITVIALLATVMVAVDARGEDEFCRVYGRIMVVTDIFPRIVEPAIGVAIEARRFDPVVVLDSALLYIPGKFETSTDSSGLWYLDLYPGAYRFEFMGYRFMWPDSVMIPVRATWLYESNLWVRRK